MVLRIIKNVNYCANIVNICKNLIILFLLGITILGEFMNIYKRKKHNTTKTELVKMLLNNKLDTKDEKELLNLLIEQPLSIDIDKEEDENITIGDKIADKVSAVVGSWTFIIIFICILIGWMVLNGIVLKKGSEIDPYPFILLNLLLSCVAAIQAPIIMMSQNRKAKKDSKRHQNDYKIDLKSELILEELHKKIDLVLKHQKEIIKNKKQ